ncbi:MAG: YncE family protein, partial [Candidatus Micrarchaeia archaeon]
VINTTTNQVVDSIYMGAELVNGGGYYLALEPTSVAITPNGDYAYVTAFGNKGNVSVINITTNHIIAHINLNDASNVYDVAISPNGDYAYVTTYNGTGSVFVISTATNKILTDILGLYDPRGLVVTPNGNYVYVADSESLTNPIKIISTSTNQVIGGTGDYAAAAVDSLAITPNGNYVYIPSSNLGWNSYPNNVSVINTATNKVVAEIPGFNSPSGIAVTPNGNYVYVTNTDNDSVSVISTATNKIVATILHV